MARPLEGLRVLDLSRVLAGPFAGRMLSDLGADVVKLEPPEGDVTRGWGDIRHGISGYYTQQNSGKRTICLDLAHPDGRAIVHALAANVDILIENFRPGVMARHGVAWDDLAPLNPRLIMLSISGFGQEGPEASRAAYASVLHAESGLIARQSELDGYAPTDPVLSIADMNAGLHGLVATLAAVVHRERGGVGQHIDLSMLDVMLVTDDYATFTLDDYPLTRGGGEVWDATGGPIMVTGDFRTLFRDLVRRHGLVDPTPEGASLPEKIRYRRDAVQAWFSSFEDRAELVAALDRSNLAWGDVRSTAAAYASPTAQARGVAAEVEDRGGSTRRVVQSPYRFSSAESGVIGAPAYKGEHNHEILEAWGGFSREAIEAFEKGGVLIAREKP